MHGEPTVKAAPVIQEIDATATEEVAVPVILADTQKDDESTVRKEKEDDPTLVPEIANNIQPESESKERSVSLLETLQSSLAAASLQNEQAWKPDPPPPPLFDDFDNEDDWLV